VNSPCANANSSSKRRTWPNVLLFLCANKKNVSAFEILALILKKLPFSACTREFLQLRSSFFTVTKWARICDVANALLVERKS
jgi:hypothetical protein